MIRALLGLGALLWTTACSSPEAGRTRGGGPGADIGNRKGPVEFHAGSRPYFKTPCRGIPEPCQEPKPARTAKRF
jgi:hypothetical protein